MRMDGPNAAACAKGIVYPFVRSRAIVVSRHVRADCLRHRYDIVSAVSRSQNTKKAQSKLRQEFDPGKRSFWNRQRTGVPGNWKKRRHCDPGRLGIVNRDLGIVEYND